jgi:iron only hydrogenase large subunit-like protein
MKNYTYVQCTESVVGGVGLKTKDTDKNETRDERNRTDLEKLVIIRNKDNTRTKKMLMERKTNK